MSPVFLTDAMTKNDYQSGSPPEENGESFLDYLQRIHPDIGKRFSKADEIERLLSAHNAFLELPSGKKALTPGVAHALICMAREHWGILLIFMFALLLRMLRINFGLPYLYHYDEPYVMFPALRIFMTGDFNPHFFRYPSLLIYLELLVVALFYLWGMANGALASSHDIAFLWHWEITTPDLFLWGRSLVALFGAATVVPLYLVGYKVFRSKRAGVLGALFLAVSEAHIDLSTPIKADVPTAFFVVASIYFSLKILRNDRWSNYIAAGILGGLAISAKYNTFLVVVPYVLACTLSWRNGRNMWAKSLCGLVALPLAFLATTPFALLDFSSFIQDIGYEARHYGVVGHPGSTGEGNFLFFGKWLLFASFGTALIPALALIGTCVGAVRKRKEMVVMLSFPTLFFCYMAIQKISHTNNLAPVLPFLALCGGMAALVEHRKFSARWLLLLLGILVAAGPGLQALKRSREVRFERDTRTVAVQWMKENLPQGSKVAIASELHFFVPEFTDTPFEVSELSQREAAPGILQTEKFDFYVAGQYRQNRRTEQTLTEYDKYFTHLRPMQTFDGDFAYLEYPIKNPRILVYKL